MKNKLFSIFVWVFIVGLFFIIGYRIYLGPEVDVIDPNKSTKDSVLILNNRLEKEEYISDSLKNDIGIYENKIESQKKNLQLVKNKYEKARNTILQLNAVASVELLAKNLAADTVDR